MTTILIVAVAVVVTAAVTYLFLRANPNKRAKLDEVVDKAKDKLKNLE